MTDTKQEKRFYCEKSPHHKGMYSIIDRAAPKNHQVICTAWKDIGFVADALNPRPANDVDLGLSDKIRAWFEVGEGDPDDLLDKCLIALNTPTAPVSEYKSFAPCPRCNASVFSDWNYPYCCGHCKSKAEEEIQQALSTPQGEDNE